MAATKIKTPVPCPQCGAIRLIGAEQARNAKARRIVCIDCRAKGNSTHGKSETRAYHAWENMRARCQNPSFKSYPQYGGRGIRICDRWQTFANFYADMGDPPEGRSLDRIDNDGDYEPTNCRWATRKQQQLNRRVNRHLTVNGETKTLTEWADGLGAEAYNILKRLKIGWTLEDAVTVPIGQRPSGRLRDSGVVLGSARAADAQGKDQLQP